MTTSKTNSKIKASKPAAASKLAEIPSASELTNLRSATALVSGNFPEEWDDEFRDEFEDEPIRVRVDQAGAELRLPADLLLAEALFRALPKYWYWHGETPPWDRHRISIEAYKDLSWDLDDVLTHEVEIREWIEYLRGQDWVEYLREARECACHQ